MGFSRQEYWSGLPFPSPGNLPDPGIEPRSPALRATREAQTKESHTVNLTVKGIHRESLILREEGEGIKAM